MAPAADIPAALARVTLRMASSLDLAEVLSEITRGLVDGLGAALARIWLIDPNDGGMLRLAASAELSERIDGSRSRVPVGTLKIGQIAQTRSPLSSTELTSDPRFSDPEWIRTKAAAAAPRMHEPCACEIEPVTAAIVEATPRSKKSPSTRRGAGSC